MPRATLAALPILAFYAALAVAASPDQFYTNGNGAYAWSADAHKNMQTCMWFARYPADSPTYRQLTAVIYDDKPNDVIYLDTAAKRVVGRLDLDTEKYSLLPLNKQKVRQAINKFEFPPPGELPLIEELFPSQPKDNGSRERLALPPPTFQHLALKTVRGTPVTCRPTASASDPSSNSTGTKARIAFKINPAPDGSRK
jgi:hypothetical protein